MGRLFGGGSALLRRSEQGRQAPTASGRGGSRGSDEDRLDPVRSAVCSRRVDRLAVPLLVASLFAWNETLGSSFRLETTIETILVAD